MQRLRTVPFPDYGEGDLLADTSNSHIATLVEPQSRFAILVKVPSKDTATVVAALIRQIFWTARIHEALVDVGPRP